MRILGHFSLLRIHDNMFTVFRGFRVSYQGITVPSVYPYFFCWWSLRYISEDAECIQLTNYATKTPFSWLQAPCWRRSVKTELCELIYRILWTTTTTTTRRHDEEWGGEGGHLLRSKNDAPLVYLLNLTPSLLHKAFKAPQVLADQTTNIILSHPKQSDFDHSKTIKLLLPFLVLQRNDHSLYVQFYCFT